MDILQYEFFRNALISVLLIGIVSAVIGTYIVARRMLFIVGGITHASFGGLGFGLYIGVPPSITAFVFALLSALGVEWTSKRGGIREDSSIAVFWALGMALGIIFVFLTPGYSAGLSGFLFGNILTVTKTYVIIFSLFTSAVCMLSAIFNKTLVYTAFDRDFAATRGIKVKLVEYSAIIIISICIILSIKLIGIMLLLSFLSLPQITAELFTHRYNGIIYLSMLFAVLGGVAGLFISAFVNIPASACIVFVLASLYLSVKVAKSVMQ